MGKAPVGKNIMARFLNSLSDRGLEFMGRYYSFYRAFVHSTEDPEKCDRLQLIIPAITGEVPYEEWAYPINQFAGSNGDIKYGMSILPEKGDVVWVAFEQGDPEHPLWMHGHLGRGEKPDDDELSGKSYYFKDPAGNLIVFNNTKDTFYIKHNSGNAFKIDKEGISVMSDKSISLGSEGSSAEPGVLGNKNEEALKEIASKLDAIFEAFQNAEVVAQDGGASLKSTVVAYLTSKGFPTSPNLNQMAKETKSDIITLD